MTGKTNYQNCIKTDTGDLVEYTQDKRKRCLRNSAK